MNDNRYLAAVWVALCLLLGAAFACLAFGGLAWIVMML